MILKLREPANALTHLFGMLLSVVALGVLVWAGIRAGNGLVLAGLTIYGITQLSLYTSSALYHGLRVREGVTEWLLRLDCTLVFVFIAGTYTPVCLIALQNGWRWGLLGVIWALALGGFAMKRWWLHAPVWFSTLLYVAMGWVALAAVPALLQAVPAGGIGWFVAGGVTYTVGAVIFALDRPWPRPGVFEGHAIWHLCVIAGSCCFFWGIYRYVTPLA